MAKAKKEELPAPFTGNEPLHYDHVNKALNEYKKAFLEITDSVERIERKDLDRTSLQAIKFLREVMQVSDDMELNQTCNTLKKYIEDGVYAKLPRHIRDLSNEYKHDRQIIKHDQYKLQTSLSDLAKEYQTQTSTEKLQQQALEEPEIVISETFI